VALLTHHMTAGRTRGFYLVLHSLRGIGQLSATDDKRLWGGLPPDRRQAARASGSVVRMLLDPGPALL
jgi:hypothetical protein